MICHTNFIFYHGLFFSNLVILHAKHQEASKTHHILQFIPYCLDSFRSSLTECLTGVLSWLDHASL